MNRRSFLSGLIATAAFDPERLFWVPGKRKIFVPSPMEWVVVDKKQDMVVYAKFREDLLNNKLYRSDRWAIEYRPIGGPGPFDGLGLITPRVRQGYLDCNEIAALPERIPFLSYSETEVERIYSYIQETGNQRWYRSLLPCSEVRCIFRPSGWNHRLSEDYWRGFSNFDGKRQWVHPAERFPHDPFVHPELFTNVPEESSR